MTTVALHGSGWIAAAHASAAQLNGMPVVAVASRTAERAAALADRLETRAVTYDQLPGDADIVVVSTPPQCHAADALNLLQRGAAVLLEKPLCTTLADADRLVEAAAAHGQRLLYAENLAYSPCVVELLRQVPQLGSITYLEARTLQSLPTWGEFTSDAWGGGALFDLGVHQLALVLLAAAAGGLGRPESVRATLRGGDGHGSDEHAELWLSFAGGVVGHVVSSWQGSEDLQWDVQVAGDAGVVRADLQPLPVLERDGVAIDLPGGRGPTPQIDLFGYSQQLAALDDDIAAGRWPVMDAAFGRYVLDVVCAAYWSAGREGASIGLPFDGPRTMTPLELWRAGGPPM